MTSISAHGATLYYELRGDGPSLLFISGATGDAGHWTGVADILADTYLVITYDRRGNSRSPRPPGWASTTVDEQADDAAALLRGLQVAPAIVFGTSAGASIAANLAIRHPGLLRGVVFHEPIFPSGVANAADIWARRKALIAQGLATGGIRAASELVLWSVAGEQTYDALDPELRERLLGNGDVLLTIEMTAYLEYAPSPGATRVDAPSTGRHGRRRRPRPHRPRALEIRISDRSRRPARHPSCRTSGYPHGLPRPAERVRRGTSAAPGQSVLIARSRPAADGEDKNDHVQPTRCVATEHPLVSRNAVIFTWLFGWSAS
jgi:pimeloyl-ACP methyl ester carboxylesterase